MKKSFTALSLIAAVLFGATSCKKSNTDTAPTYTIPTTYNFANANFADATTRLGEITEMTTLMKNATTGVLSATALKNMFSNTGSPFATAAYNTSGIQIKDQCAALFQTDALSFIDSLVKVSTSTTVASRGVAGVGSSSATPTSKYALTATGVNYAQVFTKSIMTGLVTYQIVTIMNNMAKLSYDNTTNVNGETAMEHAWDMAFGYWGVPIDFPTNKTGVKLWGSYTTQVDSGYKANKILMNAFLTGRAAISNKDNATIVAQANIITAAMEKLSSAAALQEVNEIKASISDNIARNSRLSECYGFIYSIKYNPYKTALTDAQINTILALFPKNYYDLTSTDVTNIQAAIATPYGFVSVQDIL
jgi:hypothetical protein